MTGTANGWFQIGDGRWASGNYLSDTKPSAPAPAATSSGASSSSASSSASAPSGNALSTIAAYAAATGCPGVNVSWGDPSDIRMYADWNNYGIIVGGGMKCSRYQWAATHECAHLQQAQECGGGAAVIDALGWEGLECDADRRAASKLGWSAGAYCGRPRIGRIAKAKASPSGRSDDDAFAPSSGMSAHRDNGSGLEAIGD